MLSICVFLVLNIFSLAQAWDLSHLGLKYYKVNHLTIYRNHAYISIKIIGNSNLTKYPSLIEASWPETAKNLRKARAFPSADFHKQRNCNSLFEVKGTDVDAFGRMWILDGGSKEKNCSSKVVLYGMNTNSVIQKFDVQNRYLQLSKIVVDPRPLLWKPTAYIGVKNMNILLICAMGNTKCNEVVYVMESNNLKPMRNVLSTEDIAVSKKDSSLFITSPKSTEIYMQRLDKLPGGEKKNTTEEYDMVLAEYVGEKLGPSHGLLVDAARGLCYFLTRDYAVVRWNMRKPLNAEGHDVLMQTYQQLPDVSQLVSDVQGNVWAVVNMEHLYLRTYKERNIYKRLNAQSKLANHNHCIKVVNYDYFLTLFENNLMLT